MILYPAPVSTRQFDYDHLKHEFSGDMSSTHGFGRVYDDATDEGLTLVSARTGARVAFVVTAEERDAEGDVLCWKLVSVPYPGWTLTVWNT
jgi:hypothetical protein